MSTKVIALLLFLAMAFVVNAAGYGAVYDWEGSENNDWSDPNNWTTNSTLWTWPNEEFGNEYTNQDCNEINIGPGFTVDFGGLSIDGARDGSNVNTMTLDDATLNIGGTVWVADWSGASGRIDVLNGSAFNITGTLEIGNEGPGTAEMSIVNSTTDVGGHLVIAAGNVAEGSLYISPTSVVNVGGKVYMNDDSGSGYRSSLIMDGGTVTTGGNCYFNDDAGTDSVATVVMNGGIWTSGGVIDVTWNLDGQSYLTINNGKMSAASSIRMGVEGGGDTGKSRIFLNGGVLQGEDIEFIITDRKIVFIKGELWVNSTAMSVAQMEALIGTEIDVTGASDYSVITDGDYTVLTNPQCVRSPYPAHGTPFHQITDNVLSWVEPASVNNPRYDVYMTTDIVADPNVTNLVSPQQMANTYTATLNYETTYYWRVDVTDKDGILISTGPIWRFTTGPANPVITPSTPGSVAVWIDPVEPEDAVFTVDAIGPGTLLYQWYYDADDQPGGEVLLNNETKYPGYDSAEMTVSAVEVADLGYYCVDVTNDGGTVQSRKAALVAKELLGHWTFDNTLAAAAGGIDGTFSDGSPSYADGIANQAITLDGVNDHVVFGTSDDFNFGADMNFTASLWIKTTGSGDDVAIMSNKDWNSGSNIGWVITNSYGDGYWGINFTGEDGSRVDVRTSSPINDNKWHYLCVSFNRSGMATLYYDGTFDDEANIAGQGNINAGFPTVLGTDGAEGDPWDYWMPGDFDDVKIFNWALNHDEVIEEWFGITGEAVCVNPLAGDVAGPDGEPDCVVNMEDLAAMVANWLGCGIMPESYCP